MKKLSKSIQKELLQKIDKKLSESKKATMKEEKFAILDLSELSTDLDLTLEQLKTLITYSENEKLIQKWNVLSDAWERAFFNTADSSLRAKLAEHKFKIFSTTQGQLPEVTIIIPTPKEIDAKIEKIREIREFKNNNAYKTLLELEQDSKLFVPEFSKLEIEDDKE